MDLPLPLLGIFGARILPARDGRGMDPHWPDEIEFENFSESIGIAPYSEAFRYPAVPGIIRVLALRHFSLDFQELAGRHKKLSFAGLQEVSHKGYAPRMMWRITYCMMEASFARP